MKNNDDLISREALRHEMYEEAFMKDSNMQKWDGGCWIRYKLFERVVDRQPPVHPEIEITVDQVIEFCEKNGLVVHSLSYFQWLQSRYEQGRKDGYTQGFRESAYISHDAAMVAEDET